MKMRLLFALQMLKELSQKQAAFYFIPPFIFGVVSIQILNYLSYIDPKDKDALRWDGLKDKDDYWKYDLDFNYQNAMDPPTPKCLFDNICNANSAPISPLCKGMNSFSNKLKLIFFFQSHHQLKRNSSRKSYILQIQSPIELLPF